MILNFTQRHIYIGDLILKEYPSEVYQPVTPSPDSNIRLIKPSLDISDSPFASLDLLTLELLLRPTILDYPICFIPYIYQVPSTSPIVDKFTMDACQKYTW